MANTNHLTPLGGYSDAGAIMLRNMVNDAKLLTEFLRFQGRVFKHPASVALEFFTQKPDATFIATAAQWEKAGFTVTPGSEAIRFFDEHGKTIEMFDFSQCEEEAPPMIWAVTNQNLAAVKEGIGIPAESKLIDGLVAKSVDSELIVNAMQMLNVPPQNHAAFQRSMVSSVAQIIAGRLSVNGGNFRLETDNTAFKSLKTTEQRMIYLAITGKAAREVLRQIESIVTETSVQAMLAEQEAKNAELRRMAESQRGAEVDSAERGTAADSGRSADESPDRIESGEAGRRDGMDDHTGDPERLADAVVSGVQAEESERNPDVVPVQPNERDIRAASGGGAIDGAGADRQLRDGVDALHGVESSGAGGSDADEAQFPDNGAVGGQERVGVPESSGPAVRADEPASERDIRAESGMGENAGVLHGRDSDAGARAGSGDKTVKQNTEEPSTEPAGGFSMPAQGKQLSLFGMEDVPEEVDEKTQLLRDDLGRGSGFVNGKLRIPDSIAVYTGYDSFDRDMLTVQAGEAFTLTLTHIGFDNSLKSVTTPVAGAVITLNGHDSGYVTDDRGTVTLSLPNAGAITVSAQTESEQTVPPLAQVLVIGKTAETQALPAAFANVPTDAGTDYEMPLITTGITEAPEAVVYAPIASPPMGDADAKALPPTVPVLSGCAILAAAGAACRNKKQKKSDDII